MPFYPSTIRSSGNYHRRDSWKTIGLYNANNPTNALFSLSPLFSSTNSKDIESIESRLQGSSRAASPFYSGLTFSTDLTNAPTIAFGNTSNTIAKIFMNDAADAEIGIRNSSPNLAYNTNGTFRWFGAGILDKPINDFLHPNRDSAGFHSLVGNASPYFLEPRFNQRVQMEVFRQVIPEPAEYALVFGLFAIGFIFFRQFQKKTKKGGVGYGV